MLTRSLRADGRQKSKAALDRLFAAKVKARDGYRCRLCGSREAIQCAHIFSRRYQNTRWDPENAWTLCRREHFYYTKRPDEWVMLVVTRLGQAKYEELRARAFMVVKADHAAIRLALEAAR